MNKMQPHRTVFILWAWFFLHDNSILWTVLILSSIYLNYFVCFDDESKTTDQRIQLLFLKSDRIFQRTD